MFEAIDYRAFASAKRSYDSAKPEDQATMAQENPMMLLVHELTYEAGIEQVRQRKREAQARKEALRKQP